MTDIGGEVDSDKLIDCFKPENCILATADQDSNNHNSFRIW